MKIKSSYITLTNVRFRALHGVLPQERRVGGDYTLTLRVGFDVSRAVQSDDVADTLNYATLYEMARQEMAIPSQLLEHVAGRIGQRVLSEWPEVTTVDLTLTKENPPMGADCDGASVELHLINDKTQG
jgi:dihydroneopterin aldolase